MICKESYAMLLLKTDSWAGRRLKTLKGAFNLKMLCTRTTFHVFTKTQLHKGGGTVLWYVC